jgi:hypothetical protein
MFDRGFRGDKSVLTRQNSGGLSAHREREVGLIRIQLPKTDGAAPREGGEQHHSKSRGQNLQAIWLFCTKSLG